MWVWRKIVARDANTFGQRFTAWSNPMGLWSFGDGEGFARMAESLTESADADLFSRWIKGVILAALVAGCGIVHFVAAVGWPPLRWLFPFWRVGDAAVVAGVGGFFLAIAIFMHAHYFWTPHERWHVVGQVGKSCAAVAIVVLLLVVIIGGFVGWLEVPHFWRPRRW